MMKGNSVMNDKFYNLKSIIKINYLNLFSYNKMKMEKEPEKQREYRKRFRQSILAYPILFISMFLMFMGAGMVMKLNGNGKMILAFSLTAGTLMTLFSSLFASSRGLFAGLDNDLLLSMPIKTSDIVISKLFLQYTYNLIFDAIISVAATIVYFIYNGIDLIVLLSMAILTLIIPILPVMIGTLIGILLSKITSKLKRKNIITILFSFIVLFGYIYFMQQSIASDDYVNSGLFKLISSSIITKIFIKALDFDIISILLVIGVNALSGILTVMFITKIYKRLITMLTSGAVTKHKRSYKSDSGSQTKVLYKQEVKRYFASPTYVMNTFIGAVMAIVVPVMIFFGRDGVGSIRDEMGADILASVMAPVLGFLVCAMISMACTTSSSISLEGKQLWLKKSLPIKAMDIFNAKILLNLTITIPTAIISSTLICISMCNNVFDIISIYLMTITYSVMSAHFGLYENIKRPKLDWTNEQEVIKQGTPILITMFGLTFASVLLFAILLFLCLELWMKPTVAGYMFVIIYSVATFVLRKWLKDKGAEKFRKI